MLEFTKLKSDTDRKTYYVILKEAASMEEIVTQLKRKLKVSPKKLNITFADSINKNQFEVEKTSGNYWCINVAS